MTLRECIECGQRGGFARALLRACDSNSILELAVAYFAADDVNQAVIEEAFPRAGEVFRLIWNDWPAFLAYGLAESFRGLRRLDEDLANPHAVDLRTGSVGDRAAAAAATPSAPEGTRARAEEGGVSAVRAGSDPAQLERVGAAADP